MVYIICVLIGIVTAFVGSLVGLGGGIILVPSLLLLHHYIPGFEWATPQAIVAISLVTMIFTSLSSTISYYKKGRLDVHTGIVFLIGSIPGGIFGAWLNQYIDSESFLIYFGVLTIFVSLLFFIKRNPPLEAFVQGKRNQRIYYLDGQRYQYSVSKRIGFILSLFVGLLSGLFGVGGGSIMVPAMILLFGVPVHIASATSMFMIVFISMIGAGTHIVLGHVVWEFVFFFLPGAWIGGKLGAKVNQLLKSHTLEWVLRIILIMIGIRMIWNGLS